MKTFQNPTDSPAIGEFTYEGCRYKGIESGLTFSILSEGLSIYLTETFPQLIESKEIAPVADNEYCCSKCGKDCKSKFMKERHENACTAEPQGLATILKPSYIFWNYKNLDTTQLTPDQFIPGSNEYTPREEAGLTEKEITEPAPGIRREVMIGKNKQQVTTDKEGVDWYGEGLTDDIA
jgi:hypothetical protein